MNSRKLRKGDLAYVRPTATLIGDLQVGDLVTVVGRDLCDPKLPLAVVTTLRYGNHNDYAHGYLNGTSRVMNGYWMHDDELELIELEAPDVPQTDVPLAEGELPHAGRGAAGDAPALPEQSQPPG